jgi:hypothetical protein
MNFNKLISEALNEDGSFDVAEDGDYIIVLKNTTFSNTDTDVLFKAGTVFEVIYADFDDMGCWYVVELKNGIPGQYVNRDQEYIIGMGKDLDVIECVDKNKYEIKHSLTPATKQTFNDLIDEL